MMGIFDSAAGAAPQIGQEAPDFTAVDSKGDPIHLREYRGKFVVLEWTNADCPYTHKHYSSGNMQSVQALAQKNGIVWLSAISSAPGKPGFVNGAAADALTVSYMGGIDSLATTDEADIARAEPYLKEAMLAVTAGNPAPHPVTKPYGCSIKY
jgi:AhpC/TSA family